VVEYQLFNSNSQVLTNANLQENKGGTC